MYAEVIVAVNNINVDKKFYYKIPNNYKDKKLEGYRVEVPFGKRTVQGYIVNVLKDVDINLNNCKEIKKVKDEFPVLTKELILLSEVLADELYCTRVKIIETILPKILKKKDTEYYQLNSNNTILEFKKFFSKSNIIEKNKLEKDLDKKTIDNLLKNKIITKITISKDELKRFKTEFLVLNRDVNINIKLTKKQRQLVDYLLKNNEIKKSNTKKFLNIGSSVIKNLITNEILKIEYKYEEDEEYFVKNNFVNKLTIKQKEIFEKIIKTKDVFDEYLLHGVTGSGKTEIYIKLAKEYITRGKDVIILVPEIILTTEIEKKFKKVFGNNIALLHSRLNKTQRYKEWKKIKDEKVKICLGTRSAIFSPFKNLGLIIMDEEHESSYKQNETPRYETRDIAKKRAIYNNAKVLYASATPSIETYYKFEKNKPKNILTLSTRYNNSMPIIDIVPLKDKEEIISCELLNKIKENIKNKEQILLFINKRGYTNFIRCFECGYIYKCENCDITLNYHKIDNTLKCHFCGFEKKINQIKKCCGTPSLTSGIYGTQKIEEFLQKEIPNVKITRMDLDTTKNKNSYEELLDVVRKSDCDILLGTQMISKGLDFPNITLVGILSVDNIISLPSFQTNEKLFQLVVQTSGRAGRSEKKGEVIIQSNLESHILNFAKENNYLDFYKYEINRRKIVDYPPFCKLSFITIKGKDENKTYLAAITIKNFINKNFVKEKVLGPQKNTIYKINNEYRYNIVIRFEEKEFFKLHKILKYINNYFKNIYLKNNLHIAIDNSSNDYI